MQTRSATSDTVLFLQTSFQQMNGTDMMMYLLLTILFGCIVYILVANPGTFYQFGSARQNETFENAVNSVNSVKCDNAEALGATASVPLQNVSEIYERSPNSWALLLVYDNGCPHCHSFLPIWKTLCSEFNKCTTRRIILRQVGSNEAAIRAQIEQRENVTGYPTLLVFKPGSSTGREHTGPRNLSSLRAFLQSIVNEQQSS